MTIKIYRPQNPILKKYIESFYILEQTTGEPSATYFTFPSIYNSTEMELIPESEIRFFRADNNDRTIEFIPDTAGVYNSIILTKGGVKEVIRRSK
ncbi:hypothetical protein [Chryseobacterium kwangjuense]|uniref:Uncharacterized protein n=1 Tax=Chryseobacterium kwangjuense TaxID=267125 RepID=A0A135WJJ7_9FLAO|nr:hypothetical protein [Chryseobacterium kwangjuense]KXH84952.1 hypothetical protein AU378_04130 [Chryseobacterium kwangjuense]